MRKALAIAIALLVLAPAVAQGSVRQSLTSPGGSPVCLRWHVQEYRDGVVFGAQLWHVNQTVSWCYWYSRGAWRFQNVRQTRGHKEGPTWNWGGWTGWKITHLHSPNRLVFQVSAEENGNGAYLYTEHNRPLIKMVIEPRRAYGLKASCGC